MSNFDTWQPRATPANGTHEPTDEQPTEQTGAAGDATTPPGGGSSHEQAPPDRGPDADGGRPGAAGTATEQQPGWGSARPATPWGQAETSPVPEPSGTGPGRGLGGPAPTSGDRPP